MKYRHIKARRGIQIFTLLALVLAMFSCSHIPDAETIQYDVVFMGGRVIDPESGFDQVANVAISGNTIAAISKLPLNGIEVIDASGLVISPGFIDLHSHALSKLGQQLQAMDGVTTALELEAGVYPIDALGHIMSNNSVINYGASTSHLAIRQRVIEGIQKPHISAPATRLPQKPDSRFTAESSANKNAAFTEVASEQQLMAIKTHLQQGIADGGLGVGLLLDYLSGAVNAAELDMIFQVAATAAVPVFVHIRRGLPGDPAGLEEVISLARKHQASVHVCHLNASAMGGIHNFLELISNAQAQGVDITAEAYPYNAGSTSLSAAVFNKDWQSIFGITYKDVEWADSGERFTKSMWNDYRQRFPAGQIIHHYGKEEWTLAALQAPGIIIASDAMPLVTKQDRVHPRGVGTFSKILGRYTDIKDPLVSISLVTALAKMTVLPARRMEEFAPEFKYKGRLREGFDADLTLFDPNEVTDMATFQQPLNPSNGIQYVLVNGEFVLKGGKLIEDVLPGKMIKGSGEKNLQN